MIIFNRILPYISALLTFIFYELLLAKPVSIYFVTVFLFLNISLSVYSLTDRKFLSKIFGHFLLSPLLFIASTTVLLLFLENDLIKQLFIIGSSIIYLLILLNVYSFLHQPEKYQPYTLENLLSYVNLISVFLFYASFYCFGLFLNTPTWLLTILTLIITFLITYQTLWVSKINFSRSRFFVVLISLIISEMYLSIDFLPTSYFVNAVILTTFYYFLINVSREYLLNLLNKKTVIKYSIVSIIVLILTLATAPWI